ncbi:MAG: Lipoprotein [Bacteroidetes bacterium]|jgi:hypothetical protein|nr:Lipoprotein [Bacteroidota bacterium]
MQNKSINILKNPSIFRGVFCFCLFVLCQISLAQPQLKFKDPKKNFGFVKKGEVVTIEFDFTNSGNQPAIISEAKAECSCTTVDFPKQPIAPGQSAKIIVIFDTKSVYDRQDRIVEVLSNAKHPSQKIRFKGVVLK